MQHVNESTTMQPTSRRRWNWAVILIIGGFLLLFALFNFADFHIAASNTTQDKSLVTSRSGKTMPANMTPGFTLTYAVPGESGLASALAEALPEALVDGRVGEAVEMLNLNAAETARLFVDLQIEERLWTPVYGRARVTAYIYFANADDVPWNRDEPIILEESPEIQAKGEFTLTDTTWGLLSKPAYNEMLAEALAEGIAAGLEQDVWQRP